MFLELCSVRTRERRSRPPDTQTLLPPAARHSNYSRYTRKRYMKFFFRGGLVLASLIKNNSSDYNHLLPPAARNKIPSRCMGRRKKNLWVGGNPSPLEKICFAFNDSIFR